MEGGCDTEAQHAGRGADTEIFISVSRYWGGAFATKSEAIAQCAFDMFDGFLFIAVRDIAFGAACHTDTGRAVSGLRFSGERIALDASFFEEAIQGARVGFCCCVFYYLHNYFLRLAVFYFLWEAPACKGTFSGYLCGDCGIFDAGVAG